MVKRAVKFLNLTLDEVFKTFFKGNKTLLISLLTHFLPLPDHCVIEDVLILDAELSPEKRSQKKFVLDLKLKLRFKAIMGIIPQTKIINVEMQTVVHKYFADRFLAYAGRVFSDQLVSGEGYEKLCPVYSLIFTTANLSEFKETRDYYHICTIR